VGVVRFDCIRKLRFYLATVVTLPHELAS